MPLFCSLYGQCAFSSACGQCALPFSLVLDRQRQLKTPLNIKCGYFFLILRPELFIYLFFL